MRQVIVDPAVEQLLAGVNGNAIICDSQGRAIGVFSPLQNRPPASELNLDPPQSNAEMEELRRTQRTGKPLEEILGRLGL